MVVEAAQRIIALSLGKIATSRSQRGGARLHRSLLVAGVLMHARTATLQTYKDYPTDPEDQEYVQDCAPFSDRYDWLAGCSFLSLRILYRILIVLFFGLFIDHSWLACEWVGCCCIVDWYPDGLRILMRLLGGYIEYTGNSPRVLRSGSPTGSLGLRHLLTRSYH